MNAAVRNPEIVALLALTAVDEIVLANYFPEFLYLDLPLAFTLYIGWYSSPPKGALSGVAFGWLQDAVSGTFLGLNGLSKTLLGFGGSYLSKWLVLEGFVARCVLIGVLSAVDNAVVVGMGALLGQPIQQGVWLRVLVEVPITGVCGGSVFHFYDRVKFPEKDFRRLQR